MTERGALVVSTRVEVLATILPMPEPEDVPDNDRARTLLEVWRRHMPAHPHDGAGDVEDFWEMAARLDAVLVSGADAIWLLDERAGEGKDLLSGETRSMGELLDAVTAGDMMQWGPLTRTTPLKRSTDTRADRYHRTDVFLRNAGRTCLVAGFRADGLEVAAAMSQFARAGHTEVVLKDMRPKHGLWRLPVVDDDAANEKTLFESTDWSMVHAEGLSGAFLVQELTTMLYEYRVFIVDGSPVTGAGCLEEYTPLNAVDGVPFSPLVRAGRPNMFDDGEVGPVQDQPQLVRRFVELASEVAAAAAAEGSMPAAYVIDVALIGSRPAVIEMNGVTNAGLYASHPALVARAMVAAHASR